MQAVTNRQQFDFCGDPHHMQTWTCSPGALLGVLDCSPGSKRGSLVCTLNPVKSSVLKTVLLDKEESSSAHIWLCSSDGALVPWPRTGGIWWVLL